MGLESRAAPSAFSLVRLVLHDPYVWCRLGSERDGHVAAPRLQQRGDAQRGRREVRHALAVQSEGPVVARVEETRAPAQLRDALLRHGEVEEDEMRYALQRRTGAGERIAGNRRRAAV